MAELAELEVGAPAPAAVAPAWQASGRADVHVALRNAVILNLALVCTWAVAAVVRFDLSRTLGPAAFGTFRSADATTAAWFVLLSLGLEPYLHREIPVRPGHASELLGAVSLLRAALGGLLLAALASWLWHREAPTGVWALVLTFGLAQTLAATSNSLQAMLHASRRVAGLAVVSVGCKLVWGGGTALALWRGWPIAGLALPFLAAELMRLGLLALLARRHVGLRWRIDREGARAALRGSLPFFVNGVAITVYANVDTLVLSLVSSPTEVGYYGAAQSVAGLALFLSPLIGSVLMPLLSRARARSEAEMQAILRRSIELVIGLVLPVVLLVALGADLWVRRLSGGDYGPAAPALVMLAPLFVLTYLATLSAAYLLVLGRGWTVTLVSAASMAVASLLDLVLVPRTWTHLGAGGAGVGAACAQTLTEALVSSVFLFTIGRSAFDRRSLASAGKSLLCAAAVVALDHALRPAGLSRLLVDGLCFAALSLASGAVRLGEVRAMLGEALRGKLAGARA